VVHNLSAPHKHGVLELKEIYALVTPDSMDCNQRVVYCYEVCVILLIDSQIILGIQPYNFEKIHVSCMDEYGPIICHNSTTYISDAQKEFMHSIVRALFTSSPHNAPQRNNAKFSPRVGPTHQAQPLLYCWRALKNSPRLE
jgi:hypothetical protein